MTNPARVANRVEVTNILSDAFVTWTKDEILKSLEVAQVTKTRLTMYKKRLQTNRSVTVKWRLW
ncbi:MAG: crotonobetainyl-CoA:carnitine CoA-transferase CaiB-like acyl-CoA transferase [Planktomarina sp.]|jgi:crotonobetainyl-CoA:carnitine CoA-transferase CaiB-like acyl-CoA transferase|tara:strand:+ start:4404 stop:4595 length:192 start_codon:yes stop_codon:yes gene_type:complete